MTDQFPKDVAEAREQLLAEASDHKRRLLKRRAATRHTG